MSETSIEWTEKTWNPIRGCSLVSAGCTNCYAMKQAHRFSGPGQAYEGLTRLTSRGPVWTGKIRTAPDHLLDPLRWRKPSRVFVNSMSDLFHEDLPDEEIDKIFAVMALTPQHTYQFLTKRAERAFRYLSQNPVLIVDRIVKTIGLRFPIGTESNLKPIKWPLPNCWIGVSIEDQKTADERIPLLLQTPAAVRWVSYEPALGPVDFSEWLPRVNACQVHAFTPDAKHALAELVKAAVVQLKTSGPENEGRILDWIVVGGESGPGARPFDLRWALSTIEQCRAAGVACFVKQLGTLPTGDNANEWDWPLATPMLVSPKEASGRPAGAFVALLKDRKGGDPSQWPEELRVREYPR